MQDFTPKCVSVTKQDEMCNLNQKSCATLKHWRTPIKNVSNLSGFSFYDITLFFFEKKRTIPMRQLRSSEHGAPCLQNIMHLDT